MKTNWVQYRGLVAVLAGLMVGCGPVDDSDTATDADESVSVTSSESALTTELSDEVSQPMSATAEALATAASMRVPTRFQPSGCVTVSASGATVTYTLNDCTGPYGLVHVTGMLKAVYSRGQNGAVDVTITGDDVKVNNATFDVNATVVASKSGSTKTAVVESDSTGTGPRGTPITRKGSYTVTYDTELQCVTVSGSWSTTVGARKASTEVTNFKRCKGECPASGGKIVHTGVAGGIVTIDYDGSAVAKWSTKNGRSGTVNLLCGAK